MVKVAAVQMISTPNVNENLAKAEELIESAVLEGAQLIVLPEDFACMGNSDDTKLALAEKPGAGKLQQFLAKLAKLHHIWLVGGTIPIRVSTGDKVRSACIVYDEEGMQQACYNKIHLFDVYVDDQKGQYSESQHIVKGEQPVVINTPFGKLGLAICYDLRFPELFRQLVSDGMEILAIPAAFTHITGQAHWEILLRARAIENLCFVIAAAQGGKHENGRETYGHSMLIDPWGIIIGQKAFGNGFIVGTMDLDVQKNIRQRFPVLQHRCI